VPIAAAVKVVRAEGLAAAAPQQRKALPATIREAKSAAAGRATVEWAGTVIAGAEEQPVEDRALLETKRDLAALSRKRRSLRARAQVGGDGRRRAPGSAHGFDSEVIAPPLNILVQKCQVL
jgi:hypothetical protein